MSALPSVTFPHHGNVVYDAAGVANKGAIQFSMHPAQKAQDLRKYRAAQNTTSELEVNHGVDMKNKENA
jgi:hypothetical protein